MGWEAGISVASGSGISCFYRVEMRDWQGKQSGIRDFSSSVTSSEIDVTNAKPEAGENEPRLCAYSCVWFQFLIHDLATTLYSARSSQVYPLSLTLL